MCYRASVTLQCDPLGIHARPSVWLGSKLQGIDALVQFDRDGVTADIRSDLAIIDIMEAAIVLGLECGSSFIITCRGVQAQEAFVALREGFTTSCFEGSEFIPLDSLGETNDV